MIRLPTLTPRQLLIVLHDLLVTATAIVATFFVRFEGAQLDQRVDWLALGLPAFLGFAATILFISGLHEAKWRFTSLPELMVIVRASAVLALTLLMFDYVLLSPNLFGTFFFGKVTIALYWLLQ